MSLPRIARCLLIFTALLLPLQSMAAVAMSLCRHEPAQQTLDTAAATHDHCAHEDTAPAAPQPSHDGGCDNCGVCHLASGYLAASELTTDVAPYPHVFEEGPAAARPSHIPEPPRYPPRRSA